jgi:hypothetical protein
MYCIYVVLFIYYLVIHVVFNVIVSPYTLSSGSIWS